MIYCIQMYKVFASVKQSISVTTSGLQSSILVYLFREECKHTRSGSVKAY